MKDKKNKSFWEWTGFANKSLWNWLELLIVPALIAGGTLYIKAAIQEQSNKISLEQHRQNVLQDSISRLATLEEEDLSLNRVDFIRVEVLSALEQLDGKRKGILLNFLIESELTERKEFHLERADLSHINLGLADLSFISLKGANLAQANLEKANFSGAKLSALEIRIDPIIGPASASFKERFSPEVNLSNANLKEAVFIETDLSNANLSGANLSGAILKNADLSGANLSDADLSNADLSDTKNLEEAIFCNTIMPDGESKDEDC